MRITAALVGVCLLAGCGIGGNAAGTATLCTGLARELAGVRADGYADARAGARCRKAA
jgi:hypothetical protein